MSEYWDGYSTACRKLCRGIYASQMEVASHSYDDAIMLLVAAPFDMNARRWLVLAWLGIKHQADWYGHEVAQAWGLRFSHARLRRK